MKRTVQYMKNKTQKRLEKFLEKELELMFPGKENYVIDFENDRVIFGNDDELDIEMLFINDFIDLLKKND